jgi:hypothetical protein
MEKYGAATNAKQFDRLFHDQFDQRFQIQLGHYRPDYIGNPALSIDMIQRLAVFLVIVFTLLADTNLAWFSHDAFAPRAGGYAPMRRHFARFFGY